MRSIPFVRDKALRWSTGTVLLSGLVWYAQAYLPDAEALRSREAALSSREAAVRAARAATVVLGPAGLDSLLAKFRADSTLLATRIPPADAAPVVAGEVKDALAEAERQFGVRIAASEPLPDAAEGVFHAGGYALRVVGPYHGIGALLDRVSSLPRVTKIRGFRMHAVPDSLVGSAVPYGASPAGGGLVRPDSLGSAAALADVGEAPFAAAASFHLIWYTLPPLAGPRDSTGVVSSSFAPESVP